MKVNRITRKAGLAVSAAALAVTGALAPVALAPAGAQTSGTVKVTVGDNFYKPEEVEVTAGTKVKWTNKGKILHNVRPNKGKKFGTASLARGKSYSYTFKKPGKYAYYCSFHGAPNSGQHGTIIVTPAAVPTTTTTAPATP